MYYKYPRTPHLNYSLGATNDNVFNNFKGKEGKLKL
jgi:hypothetical protein